jgi:hypothetical protein
VNDFIEAKWVVEGPHPEDGRKKLIYITPDHNQADGFERGFQELINELLRLYDAGEITRVDPDKKSS